MFSSIPMTRKENPPDTLCATLEEKMQYEDGEQDMVMLPHKIEIKWKDGSKEAPTYGLEFQEEIQLWSPQWEFYAQSLLN